MGKRELLLAAAFVLVGFAVYQFTAPPADPNRTGFSFSNLIGEIRREIRGQSASAEARNTIPIAVSATVREIRVDLTSGPITIVGEDRNDIEADLHVRSSGADADEAAGFVKATTLKSDEAGALLILRVDFPRGGRQNASLSLKVPNRLGLRIEGKSGVLTVSGLSSVSIGTSRGESTIKDVAGAVSVVQRGSTLTVQNVGSLRLQGSGGGDIRVANVRGDALLNVNGGELRAEHLAGAMELESRNADVRLEHLDKLRGPVRLNVVGGELDVTGLRTEARIDGREAELRVEQAAAATLGLYSEGGGEVVLTVPPDGFRLDALAVDGRIAVDEALKKAGITESTPPESTGPTAPQRQESRATGSVHNGGPTLTVRASRGDITIRAK